MCRVRRSSRGLAFVDVPVSTSVRRFEMTGWWRNNVRNLTVIVLHRLGCPAERLATFYPPPGEERRRWNWRPLARRLLDPLLARGGDR